MSRTDKTNPYWVNATWWTPTHFNCPYGPAWMFRSHWWPKKEVCDLPPYPVLRRDRPRFSRWRHNPCCLWEPQWPQFPKRYKHAGSAPRWFRAHRWFGPERVRVRDAGRLMMKEHYANGVVDMEFQSFQHRHGSQWDWD